MVLRAMETIETLCRGDAFTEQSKRHRKYAEVHNIFIRKNVKRLVDGGIVVCIFFQAMTKGMMKIKE